MFIQSPDPLLFNRLPIEIIHYCSTFLNPLEQELLGSTCHKAEKIITDLWFSRGFDREEMKYCLRVVKQITTKFPSHFNKLTSLFPYFLSSNGFTYQTEDGTVKNIKCRFNSTTSAVFFSKHSDNFLEVTGLVQGSEIKALQEFNDSFIFPSSPFSVNRKFSPLLDSYFWITRTIIITNTIVYDRTQRDIATLRESILLARPIILEVIQAEPSQKKLSPISDQFLSILKGTPILQIFENESVNSPISCVKNSKLQGLINNLEKFTKLFLKLK